MNQGKTYVARDKPLVDTFEAFLEGTGLQNFIREIRDISNSENGDSAERSYHIWTKFHEQLAEENERNRYKLTLTNLQQDTYGIISRFFGVLETLYHSSLLEVLRTNNDLMQNSNDPPQKPLDSTYSFTLWALFELEMESSAQWQSDYVMANLSYWRVEAVKHDAAFRIAQSCRTELLGNESITSGWYTGAIVLEANEPGEIELPYYLWDIKTRKLLIVGDLDFVPKYTCVSHTWGRWQKSGSESPPVKLLSVPWPIPRNTRFRIERLPDMLANAKWATDYLWLDLLCIPQLEFDPSRKDKEIAKQAGIFVNSTACVAWLNDVENWTKVLPAVAWLGLSYLYGDPVLPCQGLESELSKLFDVANDGHLLFQKRYYDILTFVDSQMESLEREDEANIGTANFHSQYCCSRNPFDCQVLSKRPLSSITEYSSHHQALPIPDWFTSLWTLQEACMCPEMSLADLSFNYLTNGTGVHFTLQGIIMLVNVRSRQPPRSVKQLRLCFPHDFGHSSPMNIIMMGNERQCNSERAPAIMSVLGIKGWYEELLERYDKIPVGLPQVFGKYALPFVKEAARSIGPLFFGTSRYDSSESIIGSMLPFFSGTGKLASFPFEVTAARMDAKHNIWEIGSSGEVEIEEAIVFGASTNNSLGILPVEFTASIFGLESKSAVEIDLQSLLESLSDGDANQVESFAVHLSQDTTKRMGIVLTGASSPNTTKFLVAKAAAYSIEFTEDEATLLLSSGIWPPVPKPLKLNWLAL